MLAYILKAFFHTTFNHGKNGSLNFPQPFVHRVHNRFHPTQDDSADGPPADLEDLSTSSTTSPGSSSDFLTDVSKDSKLGRVIAQLQSLKMGFKEKSKKCDGHGDIVEVSSEDDSPRTVKYSEEPKSKKPVKDVWKDARDHRLQGKSCDKGATSNPKAVDLAEGLGKKNPYLVPEHVA